MDKKKALEILDQAVAQMNTTRQGHVLLVEAIKYLMTLEEPKKPEPKSE